MAGSDFMLQPHHHLGDLTLHHRVQLESPTFNQLFLLRDFSDQPIILRKHLQPRIMAVMIDLVDKYHFVPTIRVKNQQVSIIFAVSH